MKKIGIWIDGLTDCLIEKETGKKRKTEYSPMKITNSVQNKLYKEGWLFDWRKTGGQITAGLTIKGDSEIQGLISYSIFEDYVYVHLVESSPQNRGEFRKYIGVGGHLFAIACEASFKSGKDGYVVMTAKTRLVHHYTKTLGAKSLGPKERLVIERKQARMLVEKYMK